MLISEFSKLLTSLSLLTEHQQKLVITTIQKHRDNNQIYFLDKISPNKSKCSYCESKEIIRFGKRSGLQRYRCNKCSHTFNSLTGTPLAHLRYKERWQIFAKELIESNTVRKSACHCSVDPTTSFRWRHRFLKLPADMQPEELSGIGEVDETYFLGSMKGQRNLPRKPRKRGGKATKRGISSEQDCVLIARDRAGRTVSQLMNSFNSESLKKTLKPRLASDIILCSDGLSVYQAFCKSSDIAHQPLNTKAGIRVIDKVLHIQNVNAYDSRLHNWTRRFHGVATRYLPNYLGWFRIKDFLKDTLSVNNIFLGAVGISYQPLT
jgi:transposase-like protein